MAPDPVPEVDRPQGTPGGRLPAAGRARPGRGRPPPRSRDGGSARGDRPAGRACGTPSEPSTYCSGSPASRRASMASKWATRRRPAGSSSPSASSAPSNPEASSTMRRASTRGLATPASARRRSASSSRLPQATVSAAGPSGPAPGLTAALVLELAAALVGDQRVDDLVELAGQDLVELVEVEVDAVVGDPVLLEVVGADLLGPAAAAHLVAAGVGQLGASGGPARALSSRARSTCRALARFWIWLFSSCMATTMPVGRWVMRTAESVVLTDCPPGPDERYTSMSRSLGSMCTSISSASGSTVTVADDVCTRPWDSVTGTRWTRCGPPSCLSLVHTAVALDQEGDLAEAAQVRRAGAQHLEAPSLSRGVGAVHLEEVAGEQVGLLAALGAADLDDDVLAVVGVGGEQQQLDLGVERGDGGLGLVDLGPHDLAVGARRLGVHLAGGGQVVLGGPQPAVAGARWPRARGSGGPPPRSGDWSASTRRVGQARLDLVELLLEVVEAVAHAVRVLRLSPASRRGQPRARPGRPGPRPARP